MDFCQSPLGTAAESQMLRLLIAMLLKTSVDWKNDDVLQSVGVSITQQFCRKPQSTNCTCLCTKWSKPIFLSKRCRCMWWHEIHHNSDLTFGNDPAGTVDAPSRMFSPSFSLSLKHRFDVLTTAHLTHYSKCQLCKWSTACLSSHIRWVIALWQAYLFWCSLPTSMVYPSDQYDLADRLKSSSYNFHILQL